MEERAAVDASRVFFHMIGMRYLVTRDQEVAALRKRCDESEAALSAFFKKGCSLCVGCKAVILPSEGSFCIWKCRCSISGEYFRFCRACATTATALQTQLRLETTMKCACGDHDICTIHYSVVSCEVDEQCEVKNYIVGEKCRVIKCDLCERVCCEDHIVSWDGHKKMRICTLCSGALKPLKKTKV